MEAASHSGHQLFDRYLIPSWIEMICHPETIQYLALNSESQFQEHLNLARTDNFLCLDLKRSMNRLLSFLNFIS